MTNHGDTSAATVSFTQMRDGTRADYDLLARFEHQYVAELPDRILTALRLLDGGLGGYPVSRLEHSLQSATRAEAWLTSSITALIAVLKWKLLSMESVTFLMV